MKPWKKPLKVGLVGATGVVGETFINILEEYALPISEFRPFASSQSEGQKLEVGGKTWTVQVLKPNCFDGLDMVFFSSGDDISKEWAPLAVKAGAFAIDNSNAFRMNADVLLLVPEVNGNLINESSKPQIIANPNCSTIQLVVPLKPLSDLFGIEDVTVSTYQAVSGAGLPGYDELLNQTKNFHLPNLNISAFTVRIPALNSHAEAVWVTLKKEVSKVDFTNALGNFDGLAVVDDDYPTPLEVSGEEPVFVGRIHQDKHNKKRWLMWVVSDNLKKGAALNGLQIAERQIPPTSATAF